MTVPLLLELGFWLAPVVSASPLVDQVAHGLLDVVATGSANPNDFLANAGQISPAADLFRDINVLSALGWQVPTVLGAGLGAASGRSVVELQSWTSLFALVPALLVAGLIAAAVYFAVIAQVVRDGRSDLRALAASFTSQAARYAGYVALVTLVVLGIGAIALAFLVISSVFGPSAQALGFIAGLAGFLLLRVYLMFGDEAVFVGRLGPVKAAAASMRLVARVFWSVVGFYFLTLLIGLGLGVIWRETAAVSPYGLVPAVAGHAFVETGIATALMVYYSDRSSPSTTLAAGLSSRQDRPSSGSP
jgi:hypothetical protein